MAQVRWRRLQTRALGRLFTSELVCHKVEDGTCLAFGPCEICLTFNSQKWHRVGRCWKKRRCAACHVQNELELNKRRCTRSTERARELRREASPKERARELRRKADDKRRGREASRAAKERVEERIEKSCTTPRTFNQERAALSQLQANAAADTLRKRREKRARVSPIQNSPARDDLLRPRTLIEVSLVSMESD